MMYCLKAFSLVSGPNVIEREAIFIYLRAPGMETKSNYLNLGSSSQEAVLNCEYRVRYINDSRIVQHNDYNTVT